MTRLPRLYAIADDDAAAAAGWAVDDLALEFLNAGARLLQIRSKHRGSGELLRIVERVLARGRELGAEVIVNDRVDLALMAGAHGVHVGQTDLAPHAVRAIIGPDAIVGFSSHSREQIDAACALPIAYLAVGPIFATDTKATGYSPRGLDLVRYARDRCPLPIVAIGGISLANARSVLDAGADAVAVISDLLSAGDPVKRVAEYLGHV